MKRNYSFFINLLAGFSKADWCREHVELLGFGPESANRVQEHKTERVVNDVLIADDGRHETLRANTTFVPIAQ